VTEVARRAGHGVAVLLKIYVHCIYGQATPPTGASPTPADAEDGDKTDKD
jgi:hypothetical protein